MRSSGSGGRAPSPIVSPSRASRDSAFDSESASLPSYRSAATGTSRQSERYSSLMQYLDDVSDGRPAGGDAVSESLSTISASPAPPRHTGASASATASARRRFVWDEEEQPPSARTQLGDGPARGSVSERSVTYFSVTAEDADTYSGGSSSIESRAREIKEKVQHMKAELKEKNELAKQLQIDYARVKAARERQDQKLRGIADKKVSDVRAEQQGAERQQQLLIDKVQKDVKALEEKKKKLEDKLDRLRSEWDMAVDGARAEVRRSRRREVQQWEADETHALGKLVASRVDAMHKSAAQALAPELERVVAEGRDELSRREAEGDAARRQLAEGLRTEGDGKFAEFQKLCRDRYSGSDGDRRSRLVAETRLQEARSRHEGERAAALDQFQREKRLAEDDADGARRQAAESHRALLQSVQDTHAQKMKDVVAAHSREVSMLTEHLVADREKLASELEKDREQYFKSQRDRISRLETAARETARLEAERAAEAGLADVMDKLHQEVHREREQSRARWEEELATLREMYDRRVRDAESRASGAAELSARLRSEVDGLRIEDMESRRQLEGEKRNKSRAAELLAAARQRAQQARGRARTQGEADGADAHSRGRRGLGDSHSASSDEETIFRDLSPSSSYCTLSTRGGPSVGLIAEKENEEASWAQQALECGSRLTDMQTSHAELVRSIEERNNDEISRIRDKISLVTRRKQAALADLEDELRELRASSAELQAAVDERRLTRIH